MNKYLHDSRKRGHFDYGWLQTSHSFSFGDYNDPERIHFGALRVLNDDRIQNGMGFETHSHQNMEIITIPLKGALEHKDSTGNHGIIKPGEVQVMSAGSGISHSEYNHLPNAVTELLQIWILPEKQNIAPRYDQKKFNLDNKPNFFLTIAGGNIEEFAEKDKTLWINQDAFISLARIEGGMEIDYTVYDTKHGVFFFLISGYVNIEGENLSKKTSLELSEIDVNTIEVKAIEDSFLLVLEIPMT